MKTKKTGARWLLLGLLLGAGGCVDHVTTFVRSVDWGPGGTLLVTRCTLEQDYFSKGADVEQAACRVETKKPVNP